MKIYKEKFIEVREEKDITNCEENTFYTIDVYDGEPLVLTSFEMLQLQKILKDLVIEK